MKSCAPKRFAVKIFHELRNGKVYGGQREREMKGVEKKKREKKRESRLRGYGITWDNNYFCK